MGSEELPVERLRSYLRELKPEARALLVAELERGDVGGSQMPGADLILQALRPAMRPSERIEHLAPVPPLDSLRPKVRASERRTDQPARLFFEPLQPFLLDRRPGRTLPGRLARGSLEPIWEWIGRELLPSELQVYCDQISTASLTGQESGALALARDFQLHVARAAGDMLETAKRDERFRRRLAAQIGLPHALDDLQTLTRVLVNRDLLERVASRLPATISNLGGEQAENIIALLKHSGAGRPDVVQLALILVMGRLGARWQLIRLAIKAAESDVAARVANSPLAPAIALVFAEIRDGIEEMRAALNGRIEQATATCKEIHDAVRALRTELDLTGDSPWSRELGALRAEISQLLKSELETTPGRVRRLLRPRPAREISAGSVLDSIEVAEAEARIELVAACRNYAGELAINQIAPRVHAELQNCFDTGTPALLDALRVAGHADRSFRQSQVDAGIRLAGKLFGAEYAALLAKAASVAATEPRTVKA